MIAFFFAATLLAVPTAVPSPPAATPDPTTQMALELQWQRIKLVEMETLMQELNPAVQLQQLRVRECETALFGMLDNGYAVDAARVAAELEALLQRTRAELASKTRLFAATNPALSLLELRVRAIERVQARRVLFE